MFSAGSTRPAALRTTRTCITSRSPCTATAVAWPPSPPPTSAPRRNFLGLEYHFIETPWIGSYVRRPRPLFQDGYLHLGGEPGLGVELDTEVCRRHLAPGAKLFE